MNSLSKRKAVAVLAAVHVGPVAVTVCQCSGTGRPVRLSEMG